MADELAISDIEWQQAYNELQETLKTTEENLRKAHDSLQREINLVVTSLLAEIINTIECESDHRIKNLIEYFDEEQNTKKRRLN